MSSLPASIETMFTERPMSKMFELGTDIRGSIHVLLPSGNAEPRALSRPNRKIASKDFLVTICAVLRPPLSNCLCKMLEHLFRVFPVDACICDGDAILEAWPLLVEGIASRT